ncbi:glycolate oxidase subunit GlcE [Palleronia sp. LCG004]|uniref:glycolate oxidase subunit GlcE n=1 Tax=Palleronia sp. LCG004 TaxID=3079304 RepID=UPI00294267C0|nr:glycolate oxidase subunit GlcE [Palleronia sp. LCG004]WOI57106.1 glycolate oxidase subunit GlcE [Palleronia sp. LCG004]
MQDLAPATETELSEAIANSDGPLSIRGGATRGFAVRGRTLSTTRLSGIKLYEPGALTIVARAGTPLSEVEDALAAENQRLPFEPMDHRAILGTSGTPTIGGAVAMNASGPRRIVAGACRDCLIGVRFVDGTGKIVSNGGRVMKNVTGYDLVKMMAGSYGTLGVLSEVSFKVLPATPASATLSLRGLSPRAAVDAMSAALGSPYEVSAAAHLPGADPVTHLRLEGFEASVAYRAERLTAHLARHGTAEVETDAGKVAALWEEIRDARMFAGSGGDLWRISVKPSDGPRVTDALGDAPMLMDLAGGLVWASVAEGTDLRAAIAGMPGHATLFRASDEMRARMGTFHPAPPPLAAIARGLRARFDPRGILNPGLMDEAARDLEKA